MILIGEEITTSEGEIVGLFLTERIEAGLSPEETVARIKAQGGLRCSRTASIHGTTRPYIRRHASGSRAPSTS